MRGPRAWGMRAQSSRLAWAMSTIGDATEGILRFVRETRAPLVAAMWALATFVIAAIVHRRREDNFGWKL
ncbi:MAG TPA: hypothetical protein VN903_09090, partial [Polyangia bacterium]|nr:hypothetical protein [Polyangia bacterium]